uniref:Peptidase C1A papain C-terminal domain-containing protein n=1 Tax=Fibrocapsa japonica TaxID=94617 RepID=A0A7S2UVH1_9STRA|mmetsp:Transcript_15493/g.22798  ORF Transcript_15493/g.22798 Transcript_15493/m.22798 type:complete len:466 (+) Transcript_15493:135-1532(+)|eukprot:CAMPEP_0113939274 /NCGR_PEP_ID=MMETSP1339-20121228/5618_1 /TAXON_ID=94617 /ORGANISM="Fibrocapsa japonica" /LENGTH=465 /DNA_ID=CAMNT_0000942739 /DNA_START=130 /DNA_END=1527 /DNA_ORIENTATION=+ /assembly_acc=CAM_ASM_000762
MAASGYNYQTLENTEDEPILEGVDQQPPAPQNFRSIDGRDKWYSAGANVINKIIAYARQKPLHATIAGLVLLFTATFISGIHKSSQVSSVFNIATGGDSSSVDKTVEATNFGSLGEKEQQALFRSFKSKYGKSYGESEERERFDIFVENIKQIDELNSKRKGPQYGITKFADLNGKERYWMKGYVDDEDFEFIGALKEFWSPSLDALDYYGAPDMFFAQLSGYTEYTSEMCGACGRFPDMENVEKDNLPLAFDWRTYGAVTPVEDQQKCAADWAFAVADNIASAWYLSRRNHKLATLSAQYLLSCNYMMYNCMGGWFSGAFSYIHDLGIFSADFYPYSSEDGEADFCLGDKLAGARPAAQITSWTKVPLVDEDLKVALMKNGPLVVGVNARYLEHYTRGIDSGMYCAHDGLNHAMLLVGWGVENGRKYWILKNNWGTNWGEEGYYRIEMGKNACGVSQMVMTAFA